MMVGLRAGVNWASIVAWPVLRAYTFPLNPTGLAERSGIRHHRYPGNTASAVVQLTAYNCAKVSGVGNT